MSMFSNTYKPKNGETPPELSDEIGWVIGEFEAFAMNPQFSSNRAPATSHPFPQISPVTPTAYTPIDTMTQRLIDSMWKRAEPAAGAKRGEFQIGSRGQAPVKTAGSYMPHVAPTGGKTAFPEDWAFMKQIPRTNAITFRGDARCPRELITGAGGFSPPSSRTDRYYLEGPIANFFIAYMKQRYSRDVSKVDFLAAVDQTVTSDEAKRLLIDYLMWRKITEGKKMHLGRMVVQECLKGYISTSRSPSVANFFGSGYNQRSAWVYITRVRGGFVVPDTGKKWGTGEQEIAQWGPIGPVDILGFKKTDQFNKPLSPVYIRRSFRKKEPKAFEQAFNFMSHQIP